MTTLNAQVVDQGEVISRIAFPTVARANRRTGLAGVALIHRDHSILAAQFPTGVEGAGSPKLDARSHPAWGKQEQRKPSAGLLVVDANFVALKGRHGCSSRAMVAGLRARGGSLDFLGILFQSGRNLFGWARGLHTFRKA